MTDPRGLAPPAPAGGFHLRVPRDGTPLQWRLEPGARGESGVRGALRIVVLGDVIGPAGPLAPSAVMDRYAAEGPRCVTELDGCFVVVAVGAERPAAIVLTDRVNGLKCFVEERPDAVELVSSLRLLPPRARALDPVAVVSFLANGALYGARTLLEGVRVLPPGATHVVSAGGVSSREYEPRRFDGAFAGRRPQDVREELAALLKRAVSRRAPPQQPVALSLGGGDAATALLGCLQEIQRGPLSCFSYSCAPDDPRSESVVAGRLAAAAGVPHRAFVSFRGDLGGFLAQNARLGEGRANLCWELDAWPAVRRELPEDVVLLTGDNAFGWAGDLPIGDAADVRDAVPLYTSDALGWFAEPLHLADACRVFDEELEATTAAGGHADARDTRDFLFRAERLPSLFMPWRELFPGRPVRAPFLDRDVLAFLRHVPAEQRFGRRLLKETAYELFPALFGLDRTCVVTPPWGRVPRRDWAHLDAELRMTASPLDAWVPPPALREWLRAVVDPRPGAGRDPRVPYRAEHPRGHAAARWRPALASPVQLLLRAAVLRRAAAAMEA